MKLNLHPKLLSPVVFAGNGWSKLLSASRSELRLVLAGAIGMAKLDWLSWWTGRLSTAPCRLPSANEPSTRGIRGARWWGQRMSTAQEGPHGVGETGRHLATRARPYRPEAHDDYGLITQLL